MSRSAGIVLGLCALPPGLAVGVTFAAGVNLHYDFHPVFFIGTGIALALTWLLGRASLRAFGVGPRVALVAPLVLALGWTGLFFWSSWSSYPDFAAVARKHRVVLRTIPVYPGLTFRNERTSGQYRGELGEEGFISPPEQVETTWIWLSSRGVSTRDVAGWYDERLREAGWDVQRDDVGDGSVELIGTRGGAEIELDVLPRPVELSPETIPVDESTTSTAEVHATAGL